MAKLAASLQADAVHVPEPVHPSPRLRGVAGVAPDDPDLDHTPDEVEWIIVDRSSIGPESREAKLLATLLENDEFEVVSDTDGIVVARRVKPPVGEIGPDGLLVE